MSKTDYLESKVCDHALGTTTFTKPTAVYAGLFTAAPSDAGGGTEVSGNAYARQAVTFGAASGGSASNSGVVTFPTPTASWGTITHFAIFDTVTSGNMLYWGSITGGGAVDTGVVVSFAIGALVVTES